MTIRAVRFGAASFALAGADLMLLHLLPAPKLYATTGVVLSYHPWNFLSELVRSDYGPLMTSCFILMGLGSVATAWALHKHTLRRESLLLALAGAALLLLAFFPTDLADLTTDDLTCGRPTRIEPCTLIGRIHNPLSTLVFVPIFLVIGSFYHRRESFLSRFALVCGALAVGGIVGAALYLHALGWQGRWWTGLMQRSLVFPALLWMLGLLAWLTKKARPERPQAEQI